MLWTPQAAVRWRPQEPYLPDRHRALTRSRSFAGAPVFGVFGVAVAPRPTGLSMNVGRSSGQSPSGCSRAEHEPATFGSAGLPALEDTTCRDYPRRSRTAHPERSVRVALLSAGRSDARNSLAGADGAPEPSDSGRLQDVLEAAESSRPIHGSERGLLVASRQPFVRLRRSAGVG